jgi:hypothetical protein
MGLAIEDEAVEAVGGYPVCLMLDKRGRNVWPTLVFHRCMCIPAAQDRAAPIAITR